MKLKEITNILEQIAPLELAEDWDNVGLLAGDPDQQIRNIMLTIDLTAAVLAEAKKKHIDLIIAYHPPIWEPLKRIVAGCGPTPLLFDVVHSGMAIYSLHTALDVVPGGVNDGLADIVGIASPQPLQQSETTTSNMCKLVVFTPQEDLAKVSEAVFAAGAGHIGEEGKYSKCSFRTDGTGTFQCGRRSKPTIGTPGSFEQVSELRLETILPRDRLAEVIAALRQAHSYEEPAYDVYPLLENRPFGLGRFGPLKKPIAAATLIEKIKKDLKAKIVGLVGPQRRTVRTAAVAAGSCGTLLRNVIRHKCDFYLTGELKHHHALELQEASVTTVCLGHSISERFILPRIAQKLRPQCPNVKITTSRNDRDPFTWC